MALGESSRRKRLAAGTTSSDSDSEGDSETIKANPTLRSVLLMLYCPSNPERFCVENHSLPCYYYHRLMSSTRVSTQGRAHSQVMIFRSRMVSPTTLAKYCSQARADSLGRVRKGKESGVASLQRVSMQL